MSGIVLPSQSAWKRVTAATRIVENDSPPTGGKRGASRGSRAFALQVRNYTLDAAPRGGLVVANDRDADNIIDIDMPDGTDAAPIGIATDAIDAESLGTAWFWGAAPVLADDYESLEPGDRLGPQEDSWAAVEADGGPLEVLGPVDAGDQPEDLPSGQGLVYARFAGGGGGVPYLYKVTDDGPLQAKRVDSDGEVTGDAESFIDGSEW
jgi:hypothetical protein